VKYLFITAIEGCVDAAHHVAASEGWAAPATNADVMRTLAQHAILEGPLGDAMARAVVFRNILVHARSTTASSWRTWVASAISTATSRQ
jgi:uncharacterized protein YutE (UPF0331/DUF86 family)